MSTPPPTATATTAAMILSRAVPVSLTAPTESESPTAPPSDATNNKASRRLPPPCWSPDETSALIDSYCEKWYSLNRSNLKATHWQEVADAVGRRCPTASPAKTPIQCRHKMEKLRKRYRTEIQRAKSLPIPLSRFTSSWVQFKRMDMMEKGPLSDKKSDENNSDLSAGDNDNDNEDEEEYQQDYGYKYNDNNGNVNVNARTSSMHKLYQANNVVGSSSSSRYNNAGLSGGYRVRIPNGVSIAQPSIQMYSEFAQTYSTPVPNPSYMHNSNSNTRPNINMGGSERGQRARVYDSGRSAAGSGPGKRERESDPMDEMLNAIKTLGDGFVRTEQMKIEMAREMETMRMKMEMKRTEMILESQHRIIEAFAKAVSEKNKNAKKQKRKLSPES
ncbi:hypothetical protein ACFE04_026758 [Oxalis oulophora]